MRTVDLVALLHEEGAISAEALGRHFGVSVRTVRLHVHQANEAVSGFAGISFSRRENGYVLQVSDEAALEGWIARTGALDGGSSRSASDSRVLALTQILLEEGAWVTIPALAERLYVSPQSISNDLRAVGERIEGFGLTMSKRPRYGIRVEGSEMSRRLCLAEIVSEALVLAERREPIVESVGASAEAVRAVSACVERVLGESPLSIGSVALRNLVIHLVVALERMAAGGVISLGEPFLQNVRGMAEWPVARRIAQEVEGELGTVIPDAEVGYIAIHLAGKKSLIELAEAGSCDDGGFSSIPEGTWDLVDEIIGRIWETFRLDFRDDLELRMNLARHLMPLIVRITYGLRMENPLLPDIVTRFPLAYSVAREAGSVISRHYEAPLSDDELGYISLAFALALERLRTGAPKKNVLVVCSTGAGSARMLEASIRRRFGERIGTISLCDALHVQSADFTDIDYVFTTVPIEAALPVPVQEIGLFLGDNDVHDIGVLLDRRPEEEKRHVSSLFDARMFIPRLGGAGRPETLRLMCERVVEVTGVDGSLTDLVFERERNASTAFGGGIALPHPIHSVSRFTRVCVGISDRPIEWAGKDVRLVLLVCMGSDDHEALDYFFTRAADLLSSPDRVGRMVACPTFETFIKEFTRLDLRRGSGKGKCK